jgi:plasmid stabilization system protein ParE
MHEVVILAGAENDILETYARFESDSEGLGDRFSLRVESALAQLSEFPESGSIFRGSRRRLLVQGFPFGIFYTATGRRLIVLAVLDLRQSPEMIMRRLGLS